MTRVLVFAKHAHVPPMLREALDGRFIIEPTNDIIVWPTRATDYYVQHGQLSASSERAAASMNAQIVVIPEGLPWLQGRLEARRKAGIDTYIFVASRSGDTPELVKQSEGLPGAESRRRSARR